MPNLYDSIEEDEKKLEEEVNKFNNKEPEDEEEADVGAAESEPSKEDDDGSKEDGAEGDEEAQEDASSEGGAGSGDGKEEEKVKEDKEAVQFARQRRELAAQARELAALREQVTAKQAAEVKATATDVDPEPNRQEKYEEWLEWNLRQQSKQIETLTNVVSATYQKTEQADIMRRAVVEFNQIQEDYKKVNPEYDNIVAYGYQQYYNAMKVLNPTKSQAELMQDVDKQILTFASQAVQRGLNPAEELASYIIENFNYQKPAPKVEAKEQRKAVPLRDIERNKKRSASPLVGGGQEGASRVSLQGIGTMSNADFSRLTASELDALEQEAYGQR